MTTQLWDRKTQGGFPEVKHLKQLVRDVIDPTRDLGHVDRTHGREEGRSINDELSKQAMPAAQDGAQEKEQKGRVSREDRGSVKSDTLAISMKDNIGKDKSRVGQHKQTNRHEMGSTVTEGCEGCD